MTVLAAFRVAPEVRDLFEGVSGEDEPWVPPTPIRTGDWYLAQRNGPARILQCARHNEEDGWVVPTTNAYYYNFTECFRLKDGVPDAVVRGLAEKAEVEFHRWLRGAS